MLSVFTALQRHPWLLQTAETGDSFQQTLHKSSGKLERETITRFNLLCICTTVRAAVLEASSPLKWYGKCCLT